MSLSSARVIALGCVAVASLAFGRELPADEPLPADHAERMAKGLELFKSDVRGLLTEHCVKCHGGKKTEGEFDLTTREGLLRGYSDGPAIVLWNSKESTLYQLISHEDEPNMPDNAPKLPDEAIARIAEWIDLGAPYDEPLVDRQGKALKGKPIVTDEDRKFWSFQPLAKVEPPAVQNAAWCRTPIDYFILARQEAKGITPNAPADRRKLIRRDYFDLIGLPPTPEEMDAFVNDPASDAYEKLIDKLLESPHYGERWGRHWLDVARFAESHGYEQDYDRPNAYHFRDFVIQALNADMPFDQFVRWQIAGDEIEPDNPAAMMATGFLAAGTHATQITANQAEKERYDELDDMASTIGTSMLGLTVGCARCHDHKYDPIPQQDYYRLISTFTTTVRSDLDIDLHPEKFRQAKEQFDAQHAPLAEALARFEREQLPGRFEAWLRSGTPLPEPKWLVLDPVETKSAGGATLTRLPDGSFLAGGTNPDFDTYTFVAHTSAPGITAIKIEALAHESMVKGGPGRADNGNFDLTDLVVTAAPENGQSPPAPVKLVNPKATFEQGPQLAVALAIDGDKKSGWAVDPQFGKDHAAVFETAVDIRFDSGAVLTFTLEFNGNNRHNFGRTRLSVTAAPRPVSLDGEQGSQALAEARQILQIPADQRNEQQRAALVNFYRTLDPEWQKLDAAVQEHLKLAPKPELTKVLVSSEGVPAIRLHTQGPDFYDKTFWLKRGDLNQKISEAAPSFLQVLMNSPDGEKHWQPSPPQGWRTSYRRFGLANWITDSQAGAGNLLARVIVNRLWQHHLGRGIVASPSDFGHQGERPTHPELLDWLASSLVENGWRLKPIHKLMMTSAAYVEAADSDAARIALDPDNALFWRRAHRRLEAEAIRDAMLAASGSLDLTMYGPGSLDDGQPRRSIYFTVKRSKLIPLMSLFDAPDSLQGLGQRSATTIAPQALAMMNNSQIRGYSRAFAKKLLPKAGADPSEAIRYGYQTALGRAPADDEMADSIAFVREQSASYQAAGKPDALELALADFCQTLFSLNEFMYVE